MLDTGQLSSEQTLNCLVCRLATPFLFFRRVCLYLLNGLLLPWIRRTVHALCRLLPHVKIGPFGRYRPAFHCDRNCQVGLASRFLFSACRRQRGLSLHSWASSCWPATADLCQVRAACVLVLAVKIVVFCVTQHQLLALVHVHSSRLILAGLKPRQRASRFASHAVRH